MEIRWFQPGAAILGASIGGGNQVSIFKSIALESSTPNKSEP